MTDDTRSPERKQAAADHLRTIWDRHVARCVEAYSATPELLAERWRLACTFDSIDPSSSFVVFSEENPYAN